MISGSQKLIQISPTLLRTSFGIAGYLNLVTLWVVIECLGAVPQNKERIRSWKNQPTGGVIQNLGVDWVVPGGP